VDSWTLSDGTTVNLGGEVLGDSLLAELLQLQMQDAKAGYVSSGYGCQPHIEALNPNVGHLLDYFLRDHYEVVAGPHIQYPKASPRPAPPEGAVY
jgi:hypothetical protein